MMLDRLRELRAALADNPDAEIESRIAQYEMAFRMQASIPEVTDIVAQMSRCSICTEDDVKKSGTFAANCLQARRLAERGVRFIQLHHPGWDQHGGLPGGLRNQCRETDQASAALVKDLKNRGMLDDTLVIWGGEFGRTNYRQGTLRKDNFGRDHHGRCFSFWMAGGGAKGGTVVGRTDDYGYNVVEESVHVRRLSRHAAAPAGHRPRTTDVQVSGPLLPPHRRSRQSHPKRPRLTAWPRLCGDNRGGGLVAGTGTRLTLRVWGWPYSPETTRREVGLQAGQRPDNENYAGNQPNEHPKPAKQL